MRTPATRRILEAARALVARGGVSELSIGHVAGAAGVSKALVHYHFRDKDSLLVALVEDAGSAIAERARDAALVGDAHTLDAYWSWLERELSAGDVRTLVSLCDYDSDRVRAAVLRATEHRRTFTAEHVAIIFSRLELNPRVPTPLIADTMIAFIDGLVVHHALLPHRDVRPAFDVLWLALLTLAD